MHIPNEDVYLFVASLYSPDRLAVHPVHVASSALLVTLQTAIKCDQRVHVG